MQVGQNVLFIVTEPRDFYRCGEIAGVSGPQRSAERSSSSSGGGGGGSRSEEGEVLLGPRVAAAERRPWMVYLKIKNRRGTRKAGTENRRVSMKK